MDADDVSDVRKMMRRRSRSRQQRPDGQKGEKRREEEEEVWDRIFMSDSKDGEEKEVKVERGESSNKK